MTIYDDTCWYMTIYDVRWRYIDSMTISDDASWCNDHDDIWRHMTYIVAIYDKISIHDDIVNTWRYMTIHHERCIVMYRYMYRYMTYDAMYRYVSPYMTIHDDMYRYMAISSWKIVHTDTWRSYCHVSTIHDDTSRQDAVHADHVSIHDDTCTIMYVIHRYVSKSCIHVMYRHDRYMIRYMTIHDVMYRHAIMTYTYERYDTWSYMTIIYRHISIMYRTCIDTCIVIVSSCIVHVSPWSLCNDTCDHDVSPCRRHVSWRYMYRHLSIDVSIMYRHISICIVMFHHVSSSIAMYRYVSPCIVMYRDTCIDTCIVIYDVIYRYIRIVMYRHVSTIDRHVSYMTCMYCHVSSCIVIISYMTIYDDTCIVMCRHVSMHRYDDTWRTSWRYMPIHDVMYDDTCIRHVSSCIVDTSSCIDHVSIHVSSYISIHVSSYIVMTYHTSIHIAMTIIVDLDDHVIVMYRSCIDTCIVMLSAHVYVMYRHDRHDDTSCIVDDDTSNIWRYMTIDHVRRSWRTSIHDDTWRYMTIHGNCYDIAWRYMTIHRRCIDTSCIDTWRTSIHVAIMWRYMYRHDTCRYYRRYMTILTICIIMYRHTWSWRYRWRYITLCMTIHHHTWRYMASWRYIRKMTIYVIDTWSYMTPYMTSYMTSCIAMYRTWRYIVMYRSCIDTYDDTWRSSWRYMTIHRKMTIHADTWSIHIDTCIVLRHDDTCTWRYIRYVYVIIVMYRTWRCITWYDDTCIIDVSSYMYRSSIVIMTICIDHVSSWSSCIDHVSRQVSPCIRTCIDTCIVMYRHVSSCIAIYRHLRRVSIMYRSCIVMHIVMTIHRDVYRHVSILRHVRRTSIHCHDHVDTCPSLWRYMIDR